MGDSSGGGGLERSLRRPSSSTIDTVIRTSATLLVDNDASRNPQPDHTRTSKQATVEDNLVGTTPLWPTLPVAAHGPIRHAQVFFVPAITRSDGPATGHAARDDRASVTRRVVFLVRVSVFGASGRGHVARRGIEPGLQAAQPARAAVPGQLAQCVRRVDGRAFLVDELPGAPDHRRLGPRDDLHDIRCPVHFRAGFR